MVAVETVAPAVETAAPESVKEEPTEVEQQIEAPVEKSVEKSVETDVQVPVEAKTATQAPEPIENGHKETQPELENIPTETKTEIVAINESSSAQENVEIAPTQEQPKVESEKNVQAPQEVVVADVRFENNGGKFKSKLDF